MCAYVWAYWSHRATSIEHQAYFKYVRGATIAKSHFHCAVYNNNNNNDNNNKHSIWICVIIFFCSVDVTSKCQTTPTITVINSIRILIFLFWQIWSGNQRGRRDLSHPVICCAIIENCICILWAVSLLWCCLRIHSAILYGWCQFSRIRLCKWMAYLSFVAIAICWIGRAKNKTFSNKWVITARRLMINFYFFLLFFLLRNFLLRKYSNVFNC